MDGAPSAICRMVTMLVLAPARWSRCCPGDARNAEATGGRMEMVIKWWGKNGWLIMIRRDNNKSTNYRFVNFGGLLSSSDWGTISERKLRDICKTIGQDVDHCRAEESFVNKDLVGLACRTCRGTDAAARVNPQQTLQQSFHSFLNPSHSCGFHHWRAMHFKKWPFQVMTDPLILFDLYMSKGPLFGGHFEGALKNTLPPSQCCHQISLWVESSGEMPWCSGMGPARREETNMAWKIRFFFF